MEKYRHTSVSCSPWLALMLGAGLGMLISFVWARGQEELTTRALLLCLVACTLFPLIFVWTTALGAEVDDRRLKWRFGYGGPGWSVLVDEIQLVEEMPTHGWAVGIRGLPWARLGGFSYCAGLGTGIRLELRNGKQLGIETDEPKMLAFALREAMIKRTKKN